MISVKLKIYFAIIAILCNTFAFVPLAGAATKLKGERAESAEYYYYDYSGGKTTLIGTAGQYAENVKFKEVEASDANEAQKKVIDAGYRVFEVDGKIPLTDSSDSQADQNRGFSESESTSEDTGGSSDGECSTLPQKRWTRDQNTPDDKRDTSLQVIVNKATGVATVDVTGDIIPRNGTLINKDTKDAIGLEVITGAGAFYDTYKMLTGFDFDFTGDKSNGSEDGMFRWGEIPEAFRKGTSTGDDAILQRTPDGAVGDEVPTSTNGLTVAYADRSAYKLKIKRYLNTPDRITGDTTAAAIGGLAGPFGAVASQKLFGGIIPDINTLDRVRYTDEIVTIHLGDNGSTKCTYSFYEHFWRWVTKYNALSPQPGLLAGKILGEPDMKFDDWARNADNRLAYLAYKYSAQYNAMQRCATTEDPYDCITKLDAVRLKCLATAIGAGSQVTPEMVADVHDKVWEKSFDKQKFIDCYKNEQSLIDAKYFNSKEELEAFAKKIIDETELPPSLKPESADKVAKHTAKAPDKTQCSIGMIGWILCPVMSFIATVNDKVYTILKNWLVLAPFQINGSSNSAAFDVWQKMRNIANVIFIFAFVSVIYAQVTGKAQSAYGLRVRMPRIIIAAVLANLSYVICGIGVDVVNVLGDSLFRILVNTNISGSGINQYGTFEEVTASVTLLGGAAAGTWLVIANLSALIPILLTACIALAGTFLMLLFRQAFIIIMVVISPLAFALIALPSLDKWFDRWKGIFIQLLMVYPIFSVVFGGSNLAAEIIRDNAAENGNVLLTIFSLGVQVLPLFIIPFLIKLGSGLLDKFGGLVNDPTKGPVDKLKNSAQALRDDRKLQQQTRALNGRRGVPGYGAAIRANQRRKAKQLYHKSTAQHASSEYTVSGLAGKLSAQAGIGVLGGKTLRQLAQDGLLTSSDKAALESHEASLATIRSLNDPESRRMLDEIANPDISADQQTHDGDKSASIKRAVESGDLDTIHMLIDNLHKLNDFERKVLAQTIQASGVSQKAAHLNSKNLGNLLDKDYQGGVNGLYAAAAADNMYSPEVVANQSPEAITGLANAQAHIGGQTFSDIAASYHAAKANPKLSARMSSGTRRAGDQHFGGGTP